MNLPIRWADSPPTKRSRIFAELVFPVSRAGLYGISLAPQICGVFTHFQDGRTKPCAGAQCWCTREGRQPRWKGYLPILLFPSKKTALLEVTENAATQFLTHWSLPHGIRGLHFHIYRRTNKSRSPVDMDAQPYTYSGILPEPFDPVPVLLNIWGVRVQFTDGLPFPNATSRGSETQQGGDA